MLTYYIIALDGGAMVPISEETLEKAWSNSSMPSTVHAAIEVTLDYMSEKEENNKPSTASVEGVAAIIDPEGARLLASGNNLSSGQAAVYRAAYAKAELILASLTPAATPVSKPAGGDAICLGGMDRRLMIEALDDAMGSNIGDGPTYRAYERLRDKLAALSALASINKEDKDGTDTTHSS